LSNVTAVHRSGRQKKKRRYLRVASPRRE
jgi:hypothetical protein